MFVYGSISVLFFGGGLSANCGRCLLEEEEEQAEVSRDEGF